MQLVCPKPISRDFQVILHSSSWSKTTSWIFKEQIWLPSRKCYGKNKLYFDQKKCSKWLDTPCMQVFGHVNSNGTGFGLYIQVFLSYGLYVCIILETAHHRTTFGIFCNITQNMTSEIIATKCSTFLHQLYFFLMVRSRTLWGDKDQISSGEVKRKG